MRTKESHAKYMREYNSNPINREKKRIRDREYGRKNKKRAIFKATEWAKNHKEHRKEYLKKYYQNNKEKLNTNNRKYNLLHKEHLANKKAKYRRKIDVDFKIRMILRRSIYGYLKGKQKSGSFVKDLGCSIPELKLHLEKQWQEGMNWKNWAPRGWHIDHIKPLSKFDLSDRKQFLEVCHYGGEIIL